MSEEWVPKFQVDDVVHLKETGFSHWADSDASRRDFTKKILTGGNRGVVERIGDYDKTSTKPVYRIKWDSAHISEVHLWTDEDCLVGDYKPVTDDEMKEVLRSIQKSVKE